MILSRAFLVMAVTIGQLMDDISAYHVVCYMPTWSRQRQAITRYLREQVTPCTHLLVSFAKIQTDLTLEFHPAYASFMAIKSSNPTLKIMLSVGGIKDSGQFVVVSANASNIQEFTIKAIRSLRAWQFDGMDIDWEYPTTKQPFTDLVQTLRRAFDEEAAAKNRDRLILTAALAAGKQHIDEGYDVPQLAQYLDLFNVMTYNYHGSWNNIAAFNSPLYSRSSDYMFNKEMSQEWTMNRWLEKGAPKEKLILGLAFYGRGYRLTGKTVHSVGSPINDGDGPGPLLGGDEQRSYPEACVLIKSGWRYHYDNEQACALAFTADKWLGFDDVQSIREKTQWMMDTKLGGVLLWSLEYDDITGDYCGQGRFPLLQTIGYTLTAGTTRLPSLANLTRYSPNPPPRSTIPSYPYKRGCYYTNWSGTRQPASSQFTTEQIHTTLCTHLMYAFAFVDDVTLSILPTESNDESKSPSEIGEFEMFNRIKMKNENLITMLSLGGSTAGRAGWDVISATLSSRRTFASNTAAYLRAWGFDGIDIAWVHPAFHAGSKEKYTRLLQELHDEFRRESRAGSSNTSRLQLSASVSGSAALLPQAYEVEKISSLVDFLSVTSYGYDSNADRLMLPAPLHPGPSMDSKHNQEWSMNTWIQNGASPDKLLLGILAAGQSYMRLASTPPRIGTSSSILRPFSKTLASRGSMAYFEICDFIRSGANAVYADVEVGAYAFTGDVWVGHESSTSISDKMSWLKRKGLGGFMLWSLDLDDFSGAYCPSGKTFPLLRAAVSSLEPQTKHTSDTSQTTDTANKPRTVVQDGPDNSAISLPNCSGLVLCILAFLTLWLRYDR